MSSRFKKIQKFFAKLVRTHNVILNARVENFNYKNQKSGQDFACPVYTELVEVLCGDPRPSFAKSYDG